MTTTNSYSIISFLESLAEDEVERQLLRLLADAPVSEEVLARALEIVGGAEK